MRHSIYRRREPADAFTDLLFNALLGFAFMFVVAFTLMADPAERGNVQSKAEVLITVRWPDEHPDDVDALVEGPNGDLVWYNNPDTALMHLERDDRGVLQDRIVVNNNATANPINQETVALRALQAGEYVVNLLHYQANYQAPLPVSVKVEKLNPKVALVFYGTLELKGTGDEQTALRFTVNGNGEVVNTNTLSKRLLTRALAHKAGSAGA